MSARYHLIEVLSLYSIMLLKYMYIYSKLQNVVVDLRRQRQEAITYDMGLHVL